MGVVTPNGDLYLISVNIDASQAHQLYFTSKLDQETFFQSKAVAGVSPADYTFIQKDDMIRVRKNADLLYNANYLMYKNTAHANRWFFAFIKEIKWLSDDSSAISFETDVYQTWRWDVQFKQSLVERETTPTDEHGDHLIDEGLEYGEYVVTNEKRGGLGDTVICVATTIETVTKSTILEAPWAYDKTVADGQMINNVYSGNAIVWFPPTPEGVTALNLYLKNITDSAAENAISSIYMAPASAVAAGNNFIGGNKITDVGSNGYIKPVSMPTRPTLIQAYAPLNKKLLSWPYCLVYAHNNNGSSAAYDIDEFDYEAPVFHVVGNVNPMPQFKLVPQLYRGSTSWNWDESIALQSYPMCSYPIDAYKAWFAQNGVSSFIGTAGQGLAAAASIAMVAKGMAAGSVGGPVGMAAGAGVAGVMAISSATNATQSMAKMAEASLSPVQASGNGNSGSVNTAAKANDFFLCYKTIRVEWAKMLDEYFTQYGYKVNKLKVPSFGCRELFYYCKLINPNITGPIPAPDMMKLKNIFSNGITLWNDNDDIGVYPSPSNGITNNPVV